MNHQRTYQYVIAPEALVIKLHQRGVLTLEEAEERIQTIRDNRTDIEHQMMLEFRAEANRTVYRAVKAGLITKTQAPMELPTL